MTDAELLRYLLQQIVSGDRFLDEGDVQDEIVALMLRCEKDLPGVLADAKAAFIGKKEQELLDVQATATKIADDLGKVKTGTVPVVDGDKL